MRRYWPLILLLAAMWGASYLFIKLGVEDIPPAALTELRVLLARRDSEVILLRVVLLPTTMNPSMYARLLDEQRAEARAYIQRVVGELRVLGRRRAASYTKATLPR